MFCQPLHLFASVCGNVTGDGLEGCNLGDTWTKGFLHAIVHGANVATDSGGLNTLAKVQPIVTDAASSNLLGIIPGFPGMQQVTFLRGPSCTQQALVSWL